MVWACKEKCVDFVIRRVDQMKDNQITRDREKSRKTIIETIRKDLEIRVGPKYDLQ